MVRNNGDEKYMILPLECFFFFFRWIDWYFDRMYRTRDAFNRDRLKKKYVRIFAPLLKHFHGIDERFKRRDLYIFKKQCAQLFFRDLMAVWIFSRIPCCLGKKKKKIKVGRASEISFPSMPARWFAKNHWNSLVSRKIGWLGLVLKRSDARIASRYFIPPKTAHLYSNVKIFVFDRNVVSWFFPLH